MQKIIINNLRIKIVLIQAREIIMKSDENLTYEHNRKH